MPGSTKGEITRSHSYLWFIAKSSLSMVGIVCFRCPIFILSPTTINSICSKGYRALRRFSHFENKVQSIQHERGVLFWEAHFGDMKYGMSPWRDHPQTKKYPAYHELDASWDIECIKIRIFCRYIRCTMYIKSHTSHDIYELWLDDFYRMLVRPLASGTVISIKRFSAVLSSFLRLFLSLWLLSHFTWAYWVLFQNVFFLFREIDWLHFRAFPSSVPFSPYETIAVFDELLRLVRAAIPAWISGLRCSMFILFFFMIAGMICPPMISGVSRQAVFRIICHIHFIFSENHLFTRSMFWCVYRKNIYFIEFIKDQNPSQLSLIEL